MSLKSSLITASGRMDVDVEAQASRACGAL